MSHIVQIEAQVRDPVAIRAACSRLQLPEPLFGSAKLFSGLREGWIVQLSGWRYPVVCDCNSGQVDFDNYEGHWGERSRLDAFLQRYAVEKTLIEARRQGHSVVEQPLADGSVKLTVNVAGGAS
ncbi:hypothetical protein Q31b_57450 [Novipirellula aureliae]|uniref:DUF1257 domain-containing protein n=1 Tax=Novipirellula aureliae TaxID=2527966 RepID=A0A5C6D9J6_9BACT|nr:DUF1257 domain-containing protein [Novipirellula aureliae]TWU33428.1 hypothetical protein Q31b_57450 [Novipirellula aureliae]